MSGDARTVNPFPPHRRGLWRVRAVPYLRKEREVADRWRELKARAPMTPADQEARR